MLIVDLKAQIITLIQSFSAIMSTIEFVLKNQVSPFVATTKAMGGSGEDPNAALKIGLYTLTDLQRSVSGMRKLLLE